MKFIDANGTEYSPKEWLTFGDIALYPIPSTIKSRNDPTLSTATYLTTRIKMNTPIISANMDTITEKEMAIAMAQAGGCGILHRFYHPKYEKNPYEVFLSHIADIVNANAQVAFSVGMATEDIRIIDDVLQLCQPKSMLPIVCVDVAKGDQEQVFAQIRKIRTLFKDKIDIIGGNVCTGEGVAMLIDAGVDAVKIGVGPGCLSGETPIHTQQGSVKISDLQPGQHKVKNIYGEWTDVIATIENAPRTCLNINGVILTEDHLVAVIKTEFANKLNNEDFEQYIDWIPARLVDEEHHLLVQLNLE